MCLRLGTKPSPEFITWYLWNLLYSIPIRMGTTVRITGFAVWAQKNWICSLRSAFPVCAPLPGPRYQHLKKILPYPRKKNLHPSATKYSQQSIPALAAPSVPTRIWSGFFQEIDMENSSSGILLFTLSYNALSFFFISDVLSESIYNQPLTARPAFSVPCKLSDPRLCPLVTSDPTVRHLPRV